jgi:hypothetical protein
MCLATIPVGAKTQINPVSMVNKMLKWWKVSSFSSILIH